MLDVLSKLSDVHVIVSGDFNARIGEEPDFIFDDSPIYVVNDTSGYEEDTFPNIPRVSKDREVNTFGRSLLSLCATFNLHILNGRAGADANIGDFTCLTHNGASVIDYVLVSSSFYFKLLNFSISLRTDSDHLPLNFEIPSHLISSKQSRALKWAIN